jgi:hypothetical protein
MVISVGTEDVMMMKKMKGGQQQSELALVLGNWLVLYCIDDRIEQLNKGTYGLMQNHLLPYLPVFHDAQNNTAVRYFGGGTLIGHRIIISGYDAHEGLRCPPNIQVKNSTTADNRQKIRKTKQQKTKDATSEQHHRIATCWQLLGSSQLQLFAKTDIDHHPLDIKCQTGALLNQILEYSRL